MLLILMSPEENVRGDSGYEREVFLNKLNNETNVILLEQIVDYFIDGKSVEDASKDFNAPFDYVRNIYLSLERIRKEKIEKGKNEN